eukprot:2776993-Prymnesium_polylepis.1
MGDADSAWELSRMSARGMGCKRDGAAAEHWLRLAASGGQPAALAELKDRTPSHSEEVDDSNDVEVPPTSAMEGYFANDDGFYGRAAFTEY